ncbi:hypothetical protein Q3G72_020991 [Acer saccharum]|nr:hypothetical protein Q3G72_020991 [Acer saccharum]
MSPAACRRPGRGARRQSQPAPRRRQCAQDRALDGEHQQQRGAEQRQHERQREDGGDQRPRRAAPDVLDAGGGSGAPSVPAGRRRHHMTTPPTVISTMPIAFSSRIAWLGRPNSWPSCAAIPTLTTRSTTFRSAKPWVASIPPPSGAARCVTRCGRSWVWEAIDQFRLPAGGGAIQTGRGRSRRAASGTSRSSGARSRAGRGAGADAGEDVGNGAGALPAPAASLYISAALMPGMDDASRACAACAACAARLRARRRCRPGRIGRRGIGIGRLAADRPVGRAPRVAAHWLRGRAPRSGSCPSQRENTCNRPGQAAQQQEQGDERDPDAGHRMQVAPERAAAPGQARHEQAGQAPFIPRQPQIQSGQQHDDAPRPRQLDQHRAALAQQQFAVQARDHIHDAVVVAPDVQWRERARMHDDAPLPRHGVVPAHERPGARRSGRRRWPWPAVRNGRRSSRARRRARPGPRARARRAGRPGAAIRRAGRARPRRRAGTGRPNPSRRASKRRAGRTGRRRSASARPSRNRAGRAGGGRPGRLSLSSYRIGPLSETVGDGHLRRRRLARGQRVVEDAGRAAGDVAPVEQVGRVQLRAPGAALPVQRRVRTHPGGQAVGAGQVGLALAHVDQPGADAEALPGRRLETVGAPQAGVVARHVGQALARRPVGRALHDGVRVRVGAGLAAGQDFARGVGRVGGEDVRARQVERGQRRAQPVRDEIVLDAGLELRADLGVVGAGADAVRHVGRVAAAPVGEQRRRGIRFVDQADARRQRRFAAARDGGAAEQFAVDEAVRAQAELQRPARRDVDRVLHVGARVAAARLVVRPARGQRGQRRPVGRIEQVERERRHRRAGAALGQRAGVEPGQQRVLHAAGDDRADQLGAHVDLARGLVGAAVHVHVQQPPAGVAAQVRKALLRALVRIGRVRADAQQPGVVQRMLDVQRRGAGVVAAVVAGGARDGAAAQAEVARPRQRRVVRHVRHAEVEAVAAQVVEFREQRDRVAARVAPGERRRNRPRGAAGIVAKAAVALDGAVQAQAQAVVERAADVQRGAPQAVAADAERGFAGVGRGAERRALGHGVHVAADGADAAVQRTGRSLEDLDALDVLHVAVGQVAVVAEAVAQPVVLGKAADVEESGAVAAVARFGQHAADGVEQLVGARDAAVDEHLVRHDLDRGRHVHQRHGGARGAGGVGGLVAGAGAALHGDDGDGLVDGRAVVGRGGGRRGRDGQRQRERGGELVGACIGKRIGPARRRQDGSGAGGGGTATCGRWRHDGVLALDGSVDRPPGAPAPSAGRGRMRAAASETACHGRCGAG